MNRKNKFDPNNLKIAHKGFVLASIPLLLGLVFLGSLIYLLNQAELDAQREARSQTINYECNLLTQALVECVSLMSTYDLTKEDIYLKRYTVQRLRAIQSQRTVAEMVRGHSDQEVMVQRMGGVQNRLFVMLDKLQHSQTPGMGDMSDFTMVLGVRQQLLELTQEYFRVSAQFRDVEKADLMKRSFDPAQSRQRVTQFVWLGVFVTVLIGMLVYFFSRSITSRVSTVMDNALRLASNKPLNPALAGTDEIARLDAIFHDVARVLEKAAIRERAVVDNAIDIICSIDAGNRFMQVSPACKAVWGYEPEELVGRRVMDIVAADDVKKTVDTLSQVSQSQTSTLCENRVLRKTDNTLVDMLWSMYWSAEQKTYFCVAHDITERKTAEDRLKASEARVKLIIESLPVALIISDNEGVIETNNIRTEQMFGYRRACA